MTIRFKNDIINRHRSDFRGGQKRVYTSFKFRKDTQYKGLYLCEYPNRDKHFIIKYYLSGHRKKKKIFAVGKFNPHHDKNGKAIFGTQQCEERLFKIVDEHTNNNGLWVKDPQQTIVYNKVKVSLTIRELIEVYCKKGFPKMGSLAKFGAHSIRAKARILIGYNWRVKHLEYDNDDLGDGFIRFRPYLKERKSAPKDWTELFKRYPSGKFILHGQKFNPFAVTSIYDADLSKIKIEELTDQQVTIFKNLFKSHSMKHDVVEDFRLLWKFAISEGYMGARVKADPTRDIPNLRSRKQPNKYELKVFSVADDVEVKGAKLENGLLRVSMERKIPEARKLKTIDVK